MLYDVIGYDNQIVGQVDARDSIEAWAKAGMEYGGVLDVRLVVVNKGESIKKLTDLSVGTVGWFFDKTGVSYSFLYHFTLEKNLGSVMINGLIPSQQFGLFTGMDSKYIPTRRGIYLATSKEMVDELLEDYEYREERIPGVYSLLKVYLPESWPVTEDTDTRLMLQEHKVLALISYAPIPPGKIEIIDRSYYTISEPGKAIREKPPAYGGIGCRARHLPTGKEGKLVGFGTMTPEKTELKVLFDGETEISTVDEKELVALIP